MHLCYPVYNNSYSCDLRLQIYSTSLRVGLSLQITICVPLVSNRMENPLQLARTVQCTYSTVIYTSSLHIIHKKKLAGFICFRLKKSSLILYVKKHQAGSLLDFYSFLGNPFCTLYVH